jgi:hypothetical protein
MEPEVNGRQKLLEPRRGRSDHLADSRRSKSYDLQGQIRFTKVRCVPEVPEPAKHLLSETEFWKVDDSYNRIPNVEAIKEHLIAEGIAN